MEAEELRYEYMWRGGPRIAQAPGVFPLGTDAVLLADFARGRARRALDIGCGGGCVSVSLAFRDAELEIDALDVSPAAVSLTRQNAAINGLEGRVRAVEGDVREYKSLFKAGSYDLVFSNPPYFPPGSGSTASDPGIALARTGSLCAIEDITEAASWLLRWGGRFCAVHRPERLAELLRAMSEAGLEPKRLRMAQYRASSAPNLILVEGRRGAKPGLRVEPPLIMCGEDGSESAELRRIYMREDE